ncbi:hypothetical protein [Comamonas thiooxydans]|uniref:hypothetical protein n=1 Tax=Comamonas thiooxydans TaxID=363952 RepID=UPI000F4E0A06|nr:hypothetical protein [Comamonas thiooxydans]MDO1474029.1 hypothetical protein [Comamonas thiooxydans]
MNARNNAAIEAVMAEPCPEFVPLSTTPIEKGTSTEARRLVDEVRYWAGQFNAPDAKALVHAMNDMERLLLSAWTEVDEALCLLHMANRDQSTQSADKRRATAMEYLHKWQDRGGRMGNCG